MFCKKCGYPLEEDTYCRNCGEFTGKNAPYQGIKEIKEEDQSVEIIKEKIKTYPIIMGLIVILGLIGIAIYLSYSIIINT